ncbi:MAG: HAMP domain-containing protein, partial [Rhodospirillales bacterium]|nr:HAMP domain-containing protein [Rhodospirillales bacterium]
MSLRIPFFDDLGVGARLAVLAGFALAAVAAAAILFAVADRRLEKAFRNHSESVRIQESTHGIEAGIAGLKSHQVSFLISGEAAAAEAYAQESARLLAVLESLGGIARADEIRNHIDTLRDGLGEHAETFGQLADLENQENPGRARALAARVSETALSIESRLGERGLEHLAAAALGFRAIERRYLEGDSEAIVELVRYRRDVFEPAVIEAPLTAEERTEITALTDAYFAALTEQGKWLAEQRKIFARLDEILDYLAPAVDALAGFRREAAATILEAEETRKTGRSVMLIGAWAVFMVFGLLAILVISGIRRPLKGLALAARELGEGNREAFVPVAISGNEFGDISAGLRKLRDTLAEAETRARSHGTRE